MDLILLENQIPFFVLQDLFDSSMRNAPFSLTEVLDRYLAPYISLFHTLSPKNFSIIDVSTNSSDHDHLLGYLHKRYQRVVAKSSNPIDAEPSKPEYEEWIEKADIAFHSVVELDRSGVSFKHHQESNWSMTIKFRSSLFLCFSWFCDDVAKLEESGVLVNNLGSNQEAADMINNICKHISLTEFYYTLEFKQMDSYYKGYLPRNIAALRRKMESNEDETSTSGSEDMEYAMAVRGLKSSLNEKESSLGNLVKTISQPESHEMTRKGKAIESALDVVT
uniref:Uncharacterized protein n=1 Tax=Tanacetum cinerariifolium TaxID=118510 RepID=A0A6L2K2R8_TANCI|nr:hypothetical protein [Tanacetum cinerariifolium]